MYGKRCKMEKFSSTEILEQMTDDSLYEFLKEIEKRDKDQEIDKNSNFYLLIQCIAKTQNIEFIKATRKAVYETRTEAANRWLKSHYYESSKMEN